MERFESITISRPLDFEWALKTLVAELRESCQAADWEVCWCRKEGWFFLLNDASGITWSEVDIPKNQALTQENLSYVKSYEKEEINGRAPLKRKSAPLLPVACSILQFLLIDLNGRIIGSVVGRAFDKDGVFEESTLSKIFIRLQLINSLVNVECERLRAEEVAHKEKRFANYDMLTSVFNRRGWHEAASEYEFYKHNLAAAILSIDLDGLKIVNDSFGHAAGDKLLKLAAEVIRSNVGASGIVARLGGDEFAAIVPAASHEISCEIIRKLEDDLRLFGVDASIGYVWTKQCAPISSHLKYADEKMYIRKKEKKLVLSST